MLKCKECGSTDVEFKGWKSQLNGEFYPDEGGGVDDNWCNDCQMHTELIERG